MKGLLLKDWYMMKNYCKSYLLIVTVFIAVSFTNDNTFFIFYPCLLCGMLPVNLLGYDERSHWMQYSGTMPYTKRQIVSAKYLIGLFVMVAILLVTGIAQTAIMIKIGDFVLSDLVVLMLLILIVSTLTSSILLPFIFKLGVEKGRTAYFVMLGLVGGVGIVAANLLGGQFFAELKPNNLILALLAVIGIGAYAFSWYLSVVFFKKRDIY